MTATLRISGVKELPSGLKVKAPSGAGTTQKSPEGAMDG